MNVSAVNHVEPQDIAATLVAIMVIAGEVALSLLRIPIPSELSTAQGAILTWLFVRSAIQSERIHTDSMNSQSPN